MIAPEPPRSVFDCNIYVQAFMKDSGPSRACFRLAEDGRIVLISSESILAEVRDVLNRPKLKRLFSAGTPERIDRFIEWLREISVVLTDVESVFHLERDPKDSHYIDVANASKASYLVSRDKDLLDFDTNSDFVSKFGHLIILNPVAFIETIADLTQPANGPDEKAVKHP